MVLHRVLFARGACENNGIGGEVRHGVTSGVSCETSLNKQVTPHIHREYKFKTGCNDSAALAPPRLQGLLFGRRPTPLWSPSLQKPGNVAMVRLLAPVILSLSMPCPAELRMCVHSGCECMYPECTYTIKIERKHLETHSTSNHDFGTTKKWLCFNKGRVSIVNVRCVFLFVCPNCQLT